MPPYAFEGRVAVVTGAGRGLGRAYAHLLAERGARVVVNDLGGSIGGRGADAGPATSVADEIVAAGGEAIADANDVAREDGAGALIEGCMRRFGRVDAVIANAGIMRWAGFPEVDAEDLAHHLDVHVGGAFHTVRAAWPHLAAVGDARIVLTTSTGLFGLPGNLPYATAKAGVIGLTRSLAVAGAPHGIAANAIAPAASTRMAGAPSTGGASTAREAAAKAGASAADDPAAAGGAAKASDPAATALAPGLAAPMVAFLAHPSCPVSGEVYVAGGGRFARLFLGQTRGYLQTDREPTIEDVAANWAAIHDEAGYSVPASLTGWSDDFLAHLGGAARARGK